VVESPSASVTYEVLMSLAQCVRDQLQAHGIRAGEHAGIYLPKSIDAVAVIGGILLNGAVCVPIDPASPTERACFIVRDANLKVLVTTVALADALMQFDTQSIAPLHLIILPTLGGGKGVASLTATLKTHDDARNTCVATPDAPAHLLYTSGSTGIPKGILLSHRAAVVFVEYFTSACNISEADRFSSHAPLHFAMSIFDMFMALCNGAALILIDDGEDGNNQNMPEGNRGGYWYTFRDKKGTTIEPVAGEDGGTFAMSEGGHGSQFAARYHGKIGTGAPLFGGMGMNFVDPKAVYDGSKYAGISFWAKKAENSTGKVRLKIPDVNTDPEGGACTECFNDFGADLNLTTDWKQYIFPWKSMKQMPGWGNPRKLHITPSKIFGIQFQVNVPSANYDIYIDDLKFICQ
jgi:hypothetical protein